jgi:S-formylglutathione hydrolase
MKDRWNMKLLNNHKMGLIFVMLCLFTIGLNATAQEGQIITETVHSPSLEGNLLGDSPDRPVTIYLPPSYQTQTDKFYPVVYLLHGFTRDNTLWTRANELFDPGNILDYMQSWLAQGRIKEMIIVMPSSHNRYDGSWYNNSSVGGNWADYIARDLVDYIDRHYRTLPQRFSRAVIGHSMGGYGGMTLGLDYPDEFGCMGSMSGLLDMEQFPVVISQAFADGAELKDLPTIAAHGFNIQVAVALSAAIAGNANNPPLYADFPWERNDSGQLVQNQAVWNKFLERDVLRRLSKNVEALHSMQAIYVDCGTSDQFNFIVDARRVHNELQRLNIPHHYSEFAGGHVTNLMASTGDALELFSSVMAFEMLAAELTRNPVPADGAVYPDTWALLSWTPGYFAASHDVYLGDNFDDVNDATPESETFRGNQTDTFLVAGLPGFTYPDGLVPGTTYYWRIDEVNDADPISPWRGNVWSFSIAPKTAYEPLPVDGSKFIDEAGPTLSWAPGLGAGLHTVYFGDDFETVSNAASGIADELTTYLPGPLETDTTYYWRVDEYDGITTYKGEVWSFTTLPDIPVTDPNLMGWWKLDEGQGAIAVDWSGHGYHGTLMGAPQWVPGYDGGALDFEGADYVDTGYSEDLATYTISCWVKSPNAPDAGSASGPLHRGQNYQFNWNHPDVAYRGAAAMNVGGNWYIAGFGTLEADTWYHLAATYDKKIFKTYKDGILITSNNTFGRSIGPSAETNSLKLGRHATSEQFFTGTVDDVRIYNRALSDDEIAELAGP